MRDKTLRNSSWTPIGHRNEQLKEFILWTKKRRRRTSRSRDTTAVSEANYQETVPCGAAFCFLIHFRVYGRGCAMAYYKVRIEVWCDWNPADSDLDDIAQSMGVGEAICTMREVAAVVDRPQDIEDEEAMSFFGGSEGDADESHG